jgi:hypothetical protein
MAWRSCWNAPAFPETNMMRRISIPVLLFALSGILWGQQQEEIKSGPQPGAKLPLNFDPININGEHQGRPHSPITKFGLEPTVVIVFAREPAQDKDGPLMELLTQLDKMIKDANDETYFAGFVVFLSADARNSTTQKKADPDTSPNDQVKDIIDEAKKNKALLRRLTARARSLKLTDPERLGIEFETDMKAEPAEKKDDADDKKVDAEEKKKVDDDKKDPDEKKKDPDPDDKKGDEDKKPPKPVVKPRAPRATLRVKGVKDDWPGARAGLKANDLVLSLNEIAAEDAASFSKLLNGVRSNTPAPLQVLRDGKTETLTSFMLPPTLILTCYHESPWRDDAKDPKNLAINDKAEVTIIVYRRVDVVGNFAFGEFKVGDVPIVLQKIAKLLPKRKI